MRLTDLQLCFYAAIVNHDTKSEGNMMSSESGMSHNCGSFLSIRKKIYISRHQEKREGRGAGRHHGEEGERNYG